MNTTRLSHDLSELRRQLEEILVMLSRDVSYDRGCCGNQPSLDRDSSGQVSAGSTTTAHESESDEIFDRALAVITEFGEASPAILQMWLGIDYASAAALLKEFEGEGLISSKGKVRHKAYDLCRSRSQDHTARIADTRREPVSL